MPELGHVLAHGRLGDLLDSIEALNEPQTREGGYELFVPVGTIGFNENLVGAVIFTPNFDEESWFSDFAREHDLEDGFEITLLQDVIHNAKYQKPNISKSELIAALNYFSKHDAFIDLSESQ